MMQARKASWKIGGKYGIYTAIMILLFYLLIRVSGVHFSESINLIAYLILGVEIFLAQKSYRETHRGLMSFGRGLKVGLLVSLVCGLSLGLFVYLNIKLIDEKMFQMVIDQFRYAFESEGLAPAFVQELTDTIIAILSPEGLFFLTLFAMLFSGFILSLIITVFNKRLKH